MKAAENDILVSLAHTFDDEIVRRFLKLEAECAGCCEVVALVPAGVEVPEGLRPTTYFFDFAALRSMARSTIGDKIVPGNCHLRALDFYQRFPGRRYYWFIEYDVVYTGHWGRFLESLTSDRSDLLTAQVRDLEDRPDWNWQDTFATDDGSLEGLRRIFALLPIYRISAAGLEAVAEKVRAGWVGHFEILVPTAISASGLEVCDLGGSGRWAPEARRYLHYLDCVDLPTLGTIRFAPPIQTRLIRNMLYHPCKTETTVVPPGDEPSFKRLLRKRPRAVLGYALTHAKAAVLSRVLG